MLDRIWALIDNPSSVARAEYPEGPTTEVRLYFFGIWLGASTALGVATAWVLLRSVARGYRVRRASDQILTLDVLVVVFTLSTFLLFLFAFGWIEAATVLGSFAGYTVFSRWRLQRRERSTRLVTPRTLLLLRVFGFD
jgi:sterol desaturase/sphingolipid hydroxylase (fatty acid hydroxylase superfamily)